jgi:hypothetical protein
MREKSCFIAFQQSNNRLDLLLDQHSSSDEDAQFIAGCRYKLLALLLPLPFEPCFKIPDFKRRPLQLQPPFDRGLVGENF